MLFVIFVALISSAFAGAVPSLEKPEARIVGGSMLDILDVPYQVGIIYYKNSLLSKKHEFLCSGAIVAPNYVLTAAQCVYKASTSNLRVSRGTNQWDDLSFYVSVKKVTTHKKYDKKTLQNDIALLRVSKSMPLLDPAISMIPIPIQGSEVNDGTTALVTGWGAEGDDGTLRNNIYGTEVSMVNFKVCVDKYPWKISAGMTCAGNMDLGGVGPCNGDTGAPLVINGQLVGIFSWQSDKGCATTLPGVYTKVSAYSNWIDDNMDS